MALTVADGDIADESRALASLGAVVLRKVLSPSPLSESRLFGLCSPETLASRARANVLTRSSPESETAPAAGRPSANWRISSCETWPSAALPDLGNLRKTARALLEPSTLTSVALETTCACAGCSMRLTSKVLRMTERRGSPCAPLSSSTYMPSDGP